MRAIVFSGSPVDGFSVVGPFVSTEDAAGWAEQNIRTESWWTVNLEPPGPESDIESMYVGKPQAADEMLVTIWASGEADVAFREDGYSWGPPVPMERR